MARLTIEQIKAPDLSVASQATARAGEAFQRGMGSASDLLSKYQEGLTAQGDAELTNLLAGAKNEDEWNAIVASTDFSKMNLSEGMRANIINRRDNVLGYEQDRATRRGTDATTAGTQANTAQTYNTIGLDNNQDARLQGDHDYQTTRREQLGGLVSAVLASERDGRTNGYQQLAPAGNNVGPRADGSGINTSASQGMEGRFMAAVQEGGVSNPYGLSAIAATGRHESGFSESNGTGSWDDPSESGRPGTAGGYMSWNNERYQNMLEFTGGDRSPEAQAQFLLNEDPALIQKLNNAKSVEEATKIMNDAWRFAGYDRPGGEAAARINTARSLVGNYTPQQATQNPNQGGTARDQLYAALSNTTHLDPGTALSITGNDYDYATTGQGAINTENDRIGSERLNAAIVAGIENPEIFRPGELTKSVFNTPGLTDAQRLQAIPTARQAEEAAGTLYTPSMKPNEVLNAAVQSQIDTDTRNFENSPSYSFIKDAEAYSSDPVASLQQKLDLSNDPQALPEETSNNLMRYIDDIVSKNPNVSRGEVVAAMERSFIKDPGDDDNSSFWYNSDMTPNTIRRRFPEEEITELLGQFAGPEARNRFDSQALSNLSTRDGVAKSQAKRNELLSQAQLYPDGSPEQQKLLQEAQNIENQLYSGNSQLSVERKLREYIEDKPSIVERLSGLNPDSVEYEKTLSDIEVGIQNDSSLTNTDKKLMIAALRG
jgi:hypothetical protein